MPITPGTVVRARARRHFVIDVDEHDSCRSVRLAPIDGDGQSLTLLHPFDRIDILPSVNTPRRAGRRRVARACAAALRASHDAGGTRTLVDARVRVLPYQLEPALAVVRGQATRVLLADEVGLGKTIQAGLILCELGARQVLRRALILTPAGLREQWEAELRERFGLEVTIMDAGTLAAMQRSLPPWVNPWTLPGIVLASIDLLKRDELLPQLEHVLWDVVVVDEAHHATRGTDRHHAAALACGRARVVVLITATPHNGERSAFDDLCALGSLPDSREPPLRVFRRSRADAQAPTMTRRTRLVAVRRTAIERRMDAMLRAYTGRVWREAGTDGRLAMVVLRKRALSGSASLARSIARRLDGLGAPDSIEVPESQLLLDFTDTVGGELLDDDREPGRELAAPGLADAPTERELLLDLLAAARDAMRRDSKADRLAAAVLSAREPVIVFTEYRDTLEDLRRRLHGRTTVTLLHGAMMPAERQRSIGAFAAGAARVLLATDAAAEGLNLQQCCRWIIHYEVPWNPIRIEQRNGRVDRIGQSRRVHVWHLVAANTEEETVLARVAARSSLAARDLGDQQSVAAAVFDNGQLALPLVTRSRRLPSRDATIEAGRIEALRRLPKGLAAEERPLSARGDSRHRHVLGVVRAAVLDPHARQIACAVVGVHGLGLPRCERVAARSLGQQARRSIAVLAAFTRAIHERERAIEAALASASGAPLQPSLFDRRLVIEAEHRRRALDRALGELHQHAAARERRCLVRISLVGVLPGPPR
jgi:superfamily II DNA or RNA helicase